MIDKLVIDSPGYNKIFQGQASNSRLSLLRTSEGEVPPETRGEDPGTNARRDVVLTSRPPSSLRKEAGAC